MRCWRAEGTHIDPYDILLLCTNPSTHLFFGELCTRPVVRCCRASSVEVGLLLSELVRCAETSVGVSGLTGGLSDQYPTWVQTKTKVDTRLEQVVCALPVQVEPLRLHLT